MIVSVGGRVVNELACVGLDGKWKRGGELGYILLSVVGFVLVWA